MSGSLRRILVPAGVALCATVVLLTLLGGWASTYPWRLVQGIAVAIAAVAVLGSAIAFLTTRMSDYREPSSEEEFERLVLHSERLARDNLAPEPEEMDFMALDPHDPEDFEELIREALDDLPDLLRAALERNVAVVISDDGRRHGAYGLYYGDTVARDGMSDRIVIFRDTLLRDFGHDPDELRDQVTRTVRHELAHHLGADELGVRELGL